MRAHFVPTLSTALLFGCASTAELEALADRLDAAEARIESLESRPTSGGSGLSSAQEAEADDLARAMIKAYRGADFATAKSNWKKLRGSYAGSKAYRDRQVQKYGNEAAVVGRKVASIPAPEKWMGQAEQGGRSNDASLNVATGTHLVVFWEEW
jgi:outer membrane murein-binding lipoprotein Lpp